MGGAAAALGTPLTPTMMDGIWNFHTYILLLMHGSTCKRYRCFVATIVPTSRLPKPRRSFSFHFDYFDCALCTLPFRFLSPFHSYADISTKDRTHLAGSIHLSIHYHIFYSIEFSLHGYHSNTSLMDVFGVFLFIFFFGLERIRLDWGE
jgi:hypothetical protein